MSGLVSPYTGFAAGGFQTVLGPLVSSSDINVPANFTFVSKYAASELLNGGNLIRLSVQGPLAAAKTSVLTAIYIGHAAASGNAYDFDGGQAAFTFAGSGGVTLTTGQVKTSDVLTFAINPSKALLIAYNATTTNTCSRKTGLGLNYTYYHQTGVSQAATTAKNAGYTVVGGSSVYLRLLDASS